MQSTAYTWPSTEPPLRDIYVDAGLDDCLLAVTEVQALVGQDFSIDAVTDNVAPYSDGSTEHYCSYDTDLNEIVIVDVVDPVDMTASEYVHYGEEHSLSGVGEAASYDQDPDVTSIYVGSGEVVISISVYDTRPSKDAIISAATSALAAFEQR